MFSFDNFLLDHMPVKSRVFLEDLCDPTLAYWPNETLVCRPVRSRPSNQQLYNRWLNNLVDEMVLDTPKEIEMEIDRNQRSVKKDEPMELDRTKTKEIKSSSPTEMANKQVSTKETDNKIVQQSKPTELSLRVNHYRPDEITCSVKDGCLTIKGKRQKKTANSFSSQSFERTFTLPKDCDQENILCSMDKNGLIKLNIPTKKDQKVDEVHEIKINQESIDNKTADSTEPKKVESDEPIVEDLVEE